ncbi:MAG TPA: hypothetical protein VFQ95_07190 [Rhodanobacteraceae bacterium]|nr:hypothetical protein [Rhodanobacteraceae bacterium]
MGVAAMPMQPILARMDEWPAWRRWGALALGWVVYLGAFVALFAFHSIALRVAAIVVLCAGLVLLSHASRAVFNERLRTHDRWKLRVMLPTFVVYLVFMLYVWPLEPRLASRGLKLLVALLPVAPLVVVVWAAIRYVGRCDEFERRQHLEAAALAAVVVGIVAMTLGFVAAAGLIRLDAALVLLLVFPAVCLVYGMACAWSRWRNRVR